MVSLGTLTMLAALAAPPSGEMVLLDFGATWCAPCRMMDPTVARLERAGYRVRHVDIDREPQLAAQYNVGPIPCFVMVAGGREIDRVVGATTYARLERMFQKASDVSAERVATSHDLPKTGSLVGPVGRPEQQRSVGPLPVRPATGALAQPRNRFLPPGVPGRRVEETDLRTPPPNPIDRALAATVRLTIEDPQHNSYGTGTIIDTHGDEALVLTCGHIFRASQGRGQITVDLFSNTGHSSVSGRLLDYDLDRDLALVIVRPGRPVAPVRVAVGTHRVYVKDRVFTIGCDRGGPPSVDESYVTALNRYVGARNIEVAGQPVSGRSGGGLFSSDGKLIGVCNARDREYNEGLYSALPEVHGLLAHVGLSQVFAEPSVVAESTSSTPRAATQDLPTNPTAKAAGPDASSWGRLTVKEQSFVDTLKRHGDDAELILIVRPRRGPASKSGLFVLDQPSPAFLDQLAREYVSQQHGARRTTAHTRPADPTRSTDPVSTVRTSSPSASTSWQRRTP